MNKPITICDRCEEYARCCLNYDGDNCRRNRTVEPTNADRIRAMTDEELAEWINKHDCHTNLYGYDPKEAILDWLRQEVQDASY